jgi:membrane protease YdiL (CAAX protease family)
MNELGKRLAWRLIRIVLIVLLLLVGVVTLFPKRFLPPDMTLGDFYQGLLGAIFLALVMAAVATRAWLDYQKKKRETK